MKIDDSIRETHGMACRKLTSTDKPTRPSAVVIWESDSSVIMKGCYEERHLTPWQARYLARKLYRLARRVENRSEQPST